MNYLILASSIFLIFLPSIYSHCPHIYLRYSLNHSYCKPKNGSCPIYHSGVRESERLEILDVHNKYRSLVATGGEKNAGGLPQAADMMQMVWDWELAAVAQRRAEQCIYEHDCNNCRRVVNFPVGQNIAFNQMRCWGSQQCPLNSSPDWTAIIKLFYDEVTIFNKKYVTSMEFVPGTMYGHFTQIVWAKTWRIGCGFVAYKMGNGFRHFFVCNYGPGGNNLYQPMYKPGPPCSSCPINSCCGSSCKPLQYAGLCRMNKDSEAPLYKPEENYIFDCDFRNGEGNCSNSVVGKNKWKLMNTLGGSFVEIVLNGGETSTLKLKKAIRPKKSFCVVLKYRSGPDLDGEKFSNTATVIFETSRYRSEKNLPISSDKQQFSTFRMSLGWTDDTLVSFTFSVPKGDPAQFFDIQSVTAKNGRC